MAKRLSKREILTDLAEREKHYWDAEETSRSASEFAEAVELIKKHREIPYFEAKEFVKEYVMPAYETLSNAGFGGSINPETVAFYMAPHSEDALEMTLRNLKSSNGLELRDLERELNSDEYKVEESVLEELSSRPEDVDFDAIGNPAFYRLEEDALPAFFYSGKDGEDLPEIPVLGGIGSVFK